MDTHELEVELNRLEQEFNLLKARQPYDEKDTESSDRYQKLEARMNEIVDELTRRRSERRGKE